jgi:diacylglycerol kinase family enzyme
MSRRLCFVLNMKSGSGFQSSLIDRVKRVFREFKCEFLLLSKMEDWLQIYEWNSDDTVEAIVVIGGDGTANASLKHFFGMVTPVAFLPGGTANDFASACGFKCLDLELLRDKILGKCIKSVDLLRANDSYFLTAGGIGLGTDVALAINDLRSRSLFFRGLFGTLGSQMYSLMALKKTIFNNRSRKYPLILTTPTERVQVQSALLLCCNVGVIGGNLSLSPDSDMCDGVFETYSLNETANSTSVLRSLLSARLGQGLKADRSLQSSRLTIEHADGESLAFFGDGEVLINSPRIELQSMPGALRCFMGD